MENEESTVGPFNGVAGLAKSLRGTQATVGVPVSLFVLGDRIYWLRNCAGTKLYLVKNVLTVCSCRNKGLFKLTAETEP